MNNQKTTHANTRSVVLHKLIGTVWSTGPLTTRALKLDHIIYRFLPMLEPASGLSIKLVYNIRVSNIFVAITQSTHLKNSREKKKHHIELKNQSHGPLRTQLQKTNPFPLLKVETHAPKARTFDFGRNFCQLPIKCWLQIKALLQLLSMETKYYRNSRSRCVLKPTNRLKFFQSNVLNSRIFSNCQSEHNP